MFKKMFFALSLAGICLSGCTFGGVNNSEKSHGSCYFSTNHAVEIPSVAINFNGELLQRAMQYSKFVVKCHQDIWCPWGAMCA